MQPASIEFPKKLTIDATCLRQSRSEPISPTQLSPTKSKRIGIYTCTKADGSSKQREKIFKIITEMEVEIDSEDEVDKSSEDSTVPR